MIAAVVVPRPGVPRTRRRDAPETALVRAVIAYLNARGGFAWRNQSGVFVLGSGPAGSRRAAHAGRKGMPDVLALDATGHFIAVECKRGRAQPTPEQVFVMGELRKRGAIVIVARDIRDVERAVAAL